MDMLNLKFLEVAVHILMKRFRNYFARKGQKYVRIQTDNLFAENMSATGEFWSGFQVLVLPGVEPRTVQPVA